MWRRRTACVVLVAMAACGQPSATHTAEQLRTAIAAYKRGDEGATEDQIAALFAKLDAEVATARADELSKPAGERAELTKRREGMEADRRDLQGEYLQARVTRLGVQAQDALWRAAIVQTGTPLLTAIAAILFLDETFTVRLLIASALVITGVLLTVLPALHRRLLS